MNVGKKTSYFYGVMMMKSGLYNKKVYMPKVSFEDVEIVPRYTHHAFEARNDRRGFITLPDSLNFARMDLVELEVVNGKPFKAVFRMHHDSKNDLVLVVLLDTFTVKTVWLNSKNDKHATLRNPERFVGYRK